VLTIDERAQVQQAFAEALASKANPPSLIRVVFLDEANSVLLNIPAGATPAEIASFAVTDCLLSRWTRDPSLLEMLLDYLVTTAGIGAFSQILTRVRHRVDPNPSIYDSAWLLGDSRPFFDRHDLRTRVRHLIEQNGRPILRVWADEHSFGRTYSVRFLEHLEDCSPDAVHVLAAELSPGAGPSYRAEDLLKELKTQFRKSTAIPDRVGSSYPKDAARWMLEQMMSNDGLWLVVLDGFGQRPLNNEVIETIEALANRVTIGQHRRRVRLVLLDYPHPLPSVSGADILEETLPPVADIRPGDLVPCVAAWDAQRRRQGLAGVADGRFAELADDMLRHAPAHGRERLATLNASLVALLDMPGGPGGGI
jgi:hypothetical protein